MSTIAFVAISLVTATCIASLAARVVSVIRRWSREREEYQRLEESLTQMTFAADSLENWAREFTNSANHGALPTKDAETKNRASDFSERRTNSAQIGSYHAPLLASQVQGFARVAAASEVGEDALIEWIDAEENLRRSIPAIAPWPRSGGLAKLLSDWIGGPGSLSVVASERTSASLDVSNRLALAQH